MIKVAASPSIVLFLETYLHFIIYLGCSMWWIQGGGGGGGGSDPTHPKKTTKLHCSGTPGNSQSHQDSIQCWASIGLQA